MKNIWIVFAMAMLLIFSSCGKNYSNGEISDVVITKLSYKGVFF